MNLPYLSKSRIEVFSLCPWKYHAKYDLELPDPGNIRAKLGLLVHDVLEQAALKIKAEECPNFLAKGKVLPQELATIYQVCFDQSEIAEHQNLYGEGLGILSTAIQHGILSDPTRVLAIEKEFDLTLENNVRLFGRIDRIDQVDEQTIEIIDYKTDKKVYTDQEFSKNIQAGIYLLVAAYLFPDFPLHYFTFHFLRYGPYSLIRSTEELEQITHELRRYWTKIKELEGSTAKARKNPFCNACPFKFPNAAHQYEGCPAFFWAPKPNGRSVIDENKTKSSSTTKTSSEGEEDLVSEFSKIDQQLSVLQRERTRLEQEIIQTAASAFIDEDEIQIGSWRVKLNQKFKRQRNDEKTLRTSKRLDIDLKDFQKPDLKSVTDHIKKNHPELYDDCFDVSPGEIKIEVEPIKG